MFRYPAGVPHLRAVEVSKVRLVQKLPEKPVDEIEFIACVSVDLKHGPPPCLKIGNIGV